MAVVDAVDAVKLPVQLKPGDRLSERAFALSAATLEEVMEVADERNAFYAEHTTLIQERKVWAIALAEAQASVTEHTTQRELADRQLAERQTLVDQLTSQVEDLTQQRDRLQVHLQQLQSETAALRTEHSAAQAHIRQVEDRAHQQVDRARQELKTLQQDHQRELRGHNKRVADLTEQNVGLQSAVRTSEKANAHQEGRVIALEPSCSSCAHRKLQARAPKSAPKCPSNARDRGRYEACEASLSNLQ